MSNYYAKSRSNTFRVKDALAFAAFVALLPGVRLEADGDKATLYVEDSDNGEFPTHRLLATGEEQDPNELDGMQPFDVCDDLYPFLQDGETAIFISSGSELLRYVGGNARAVNSRGWEVAVNLDDIYREAQLKLGASETTTQANESPVTLGKSPLRATPTLKNAVVSAERLSLLLTAIDPMDLTDEEKLWLEEMQEECTDAVGTKLVAAVHTTKHDHIPFVIRQPIDWDGSQVLKALQESDPARYEFREGNEGPDYLQQSDGISLTTVG